MGGVPIIRSILDTIATNQHLTEQYSDFLHSFAQHTHSLVYNQYGNYVIQQLLDVAPQSVTDTIKEFMSTNYSKYAQHKFASNVVEKCLKHTLNEYDDDDLDQNKKTKTKKNRRNWIKVIIRELLRDAKVLINHKFGNYCLQTALSTVINLRSKSFSNRNADKLLNEFVTTIRPLLHLLRLNVRKKWQQVLLSATSSNSNSN